MPDESNRKVNTISNDSGIHVIEARGPWEPVRSGFTVGRKSEFLIQWLKGKHIRIKV
jgi:hypothetical protein